MAETSVPTAPEGQESGPVEAPSPNQPILEAEQKSAETPAPSIQPVSDVEPQVTAKPPAPTASVVQGFKPEEPPTPTSQPISEVEPQIAAETSAPTTPVVQEPEPVEVPTSNQPVPEVEQVTAAEPPAPIVPVVQESKPEEPPVPSQPAMPEAEPEADAAKEETKPAEGEPKTAATQEPAIPVDQAVTKDSLTCLVCGKTFKYLFHHVKRRHNLNPAAYRKKFDLPPNFSMEAPSVLEKRSQKGAPASKPTTPAGKDTGTGKEEANEQPGPIATTEPAVPIHEAVSRDSVACLECGKKMKILKSHLHTHGLTVEGYREKFGLPEEFPMVAPSYTEYRRQNAKKAGFGGSTKKKK